MATLYKRAGSHNWTDTDAWSLTSGGPSAGVTPTAADDVILDSNSGALTINTGANRLCRSFDCNSPSGTGAFNGTVTHQASTEMRIGDGTAGLNNVAFRLSTTTTWTYGSNHTSIITFVSTAATQQTIDVQNRELGPVNFAAAGNWLFTSASRTAAIWQAHMSVTSGTVDFGEFSHQWGGYVTNGSATVNITMRNCTVTLRSSRLVDLRGTNITADYTGTKFIAIQGGWSTAFFSSFTITELIVQNQSLTVNSTGTIGTVRNQNQATTTNTTIAAGTYTTVINEGAGTISVNGGTIATLRALAGTVGGTGGTITTFETVGDNTAGQTVSLARNITATNVNLNGSSIVNRILIQSNIVGTQRTITATNLTASFVDFMDIAGAGEASWNLSAITGGSGDCGGNSGITFTTATTQALTMSTNQNWETVGIWTSRIPLPQDDVTVASWPSGTLNAGGRARLGRNIDLSGATGSVSLSLPNAWFIFGSLTLSSVISISGGGNGFLRGRGSHTITSAGRTLVNQINIQGAGGGSYSLLDALVSASNLNISGGFNSNNFSITAPIVNIQSGNYGNSVITVTSNANATVFTASGTPDLSGATIAVANATSNTRSLQLGGRTYGTVDITMTGSTGIIVINNSNTIGVLKFGDVSNARTLQFNPATTNTIGSWQVSGTSGRLMRIRSSTAGQQYTLVMSTQQSGDFLDIQDMAVTGGPLYAGNNSTNSGNNNANVIFSAPPTFIPFTIMY